MVISGAEDFASQLLCNYVNQLLGNYGRTLDIEYPSYQAQGSEAELNTLLEEINAGSVDALFVDGVNPALDLPGGEALGENSPTFLSL